jgi:hypothetical protein
LLHVAQQTRDKIGKLPAKVFWPALILVIYDTGLRITALTSIPMADVDLARGWVTVRADLQKQKAEQVFELHPDTIACLAKMPVGRAMLFPLPIRLPALRERLRKLLIQAGLRATRYDLFHKLRRTRVGRPSPARRPPSIIWGIPRPG